MKVGFPFVQFLLNSSSIARLYEHYRPAPQNDDEIMCEIFLNVDRLISIVRPRKLLYIAFDGVAPRAKMNKMRSSRFISSKIRRYERVIRNLRL